MNSPDPECARGRVPRGCHFCDPEQASSPASLLQPLSPHLGASAGENSRLDSAGRAAHPGHSPETAVRGSWVSGRSHPDRPLFAALRRGFRWTPAQWGATLQTQAKHLGGTGPCVGHAGGSWVAEGDEQEVQHRPGLAAGTYTLLRGRQADMSLDNCHRRQPGVCHCKGICLPSISGAPSTELGTDSLFTQSP